MKLTDVHSDARKVYTVSHKKDVEDDKAVDIVPVIAYAKGFESGYDFAVANVEIFSKSPFSKFTNICIRVIIFFILILFMNFLEVTDISNTAIIIMISIVVFLCFTCLVIGKANILRNIEKMDAIKERFLDHDK